MNARSSLFLPLAAAASLFATAACVRVPGEVEATFAPYEPGEPSHFHRGARPTAPTAPPREAASAPPATDAGTGAPNAVTPVNAAPPVAPGGAA